MAEAQEQEQNEEQGAADETAEATEAAAADESTEPVEAIDAEATMEAPADADAGATAEAPVAAPTSAPEPASSAPAKPAVAYEPPDELSRAPVLDINALLSPIPGDAPSGEYLRYEGIYDEISEERRADEDLALGAWQTELKVANFNKVIELATAALTEKSKDLQLAAWLSEAIVAEHGFAGLRDSLKLMTGLISNFWDSVYPEAEDGDEEGRANAIAWFDDKAGFLVQKAPIIDNSDCGYFGYLDSKTFDIPDNLDSLESEEQQRLKALREKAEKENRITAGKWAQALSLTKRAFCEEVKVAIDECSDELKKLNLAIEEKFDRNQAPGVRQIGKALSNISDRATKVLEQKRLEEPDPSDALEHGEEAGGEPGSGSRSGSGPVRDRDDALRKLSEIAAFFKRTEPHSPVAYLVSRAVSWGNMPLENWLQDVIKDENILYQLRQTLGFNTAPSGESQTENE